MTDKVWKKLERKVAKILGGLRIYFGTDRGDVLHPHFFIECKYRKKWLIYTLFEKVSQQSKTYQKIPLLIIKERNRQKELVILTLSDFRQIIKEDYKTHIIPNNII